MDSFDLYLITVYFAQIIFRFLFLPYVSTSKKKRVCVNVVSFN